MELSPIGIIVILIVVAVIGFGGVYLVTEIPLRIIRMMNKEEEKYRRQLKQKELRQKKIMEEGTEAEKQQLIYEEGVAGNQTITEFLKGAFFHRLVF